MTAKNEPGVLKSTLQQCLPYSIYILFASFFVFSFPALYIVTIEKTISAEMVMLIYFVFSFTLFLGVEKNKLVKKHRWMPTIASVLTIECFFFLLYAQYHWITALSMVTALIVTWILFYRMLLGAKPRHRRPHGFSRSCREKASLLSLYLAVILLLIPSGIGFFREYADVFSEKDWALLVEKVSDETADQEEAAQDQLLTDLSRWDELDMHARFCLLCEVAIREEQYLGIENYAEIQITHAKLHPYNLAYYDDEHKKICINTSELYEASCADCINDVLHEVFHAYQDYLVHSLDFDSDFVKNSYYYSTARAWKENTENYISGVQDFSAYENQPLEVSARAHANERTSAYLPDTTDASG